MDGRGRMRGPICGRTWTDAWTDVGGSGSIVVLIEACHGFKVWPIDRGVEGSRAQSAMGCAKGLGVTVWD